MSVVRAVAVLVVAAVVMVAAVADATAKPRRAPKPDPGLPAEAALQPMKVVVVKESDCDADCRTWISAEGDFVKETPAAFRAAFARVGDKAPVVLMHSAGGSVEASLEVGRLLRARHATVSVARTQFDGCKPDGTDCAGAAPAAYRGTPVEAAVCVSACVFAFAGGEERLTGIWSTLAVHQAVRVRTSVERRVLVRYRIVDGRKVVVSRRVLDERALKPTRSVVGPEDRFYRDLGRYFTAMGVGDGLIKVIRATPAADIKVLSHEEAKAERLITGAADTRVLPRTRTAAAPGPRLRSEPGGPVPSGAGEARPGETGQSEAPRSDAAKNDAPKSDGIKSDGGMPGASPSEKVGVRLTFRSDPERSLRPILWFDWMPQTATVSVYIGSRVGSDDGDAASAVYTLDAGEAGSFAATRLRYRPPYDDQPVKGAGDGASIDSGAYLVARAKARPIFYRATMPVAAFCRLAEAGEASVRVELRRTAQGEPETSTLRKSMSAAAEAIRTKACTPTQASGRP